MNDQERLTALAKEIADVLVRAEATDVRALISLSLDVEGDQDGPGGLLMFNHTEHTAMADLISSLRTVGDACGKTVVVGGVGFALSPDQPTMEGTQ
jgi:hypothetical protein